MVRYGSRRGIVAASVKASYLWKHFEKVKLSIPQRDFNDKYHSHFVDSIGNGTAGADNGAVRLRNYAATTSLDKVVKFVYPELENPERCVGSTIICAHNVTCNFINRKIMGMLPGKGEMLQSADKLIVDDLAGEDLVSDEFLKQQMNTGVPESELYLKVGSVCMLMRNLDRDAGLMNNTKVIVTFITRRYVYVRKLGEDVEYPIPRITTKYKLHGTELTASRRQFPLRIAYAVTVNRSQGQTYDRVGIDTRADYFSHGQLYVALGRAQSKQDIMVLSSAKRMRDGDAVVENIVWEELLEKEESDCRTHESVFLDPRVEFDAMGGDDEDADGMDGEDVFGAWRVPKETSDVEDLDDFGAWRGEEMGGPEAEDESWQAWRDYTLDEVGKENKFDLSFFGLGRCRVCGRNHESGECFVHRKIEDLEHACAQALQEYCVVDGAEVSDGEVWVEEVPPDGVCMFHAVARVCPAFGDGFELREAVLDLLLENAGESVNGIPLSDYIEWEFEESVNEYIDEMFAGRWGGALELIIMSKLLGVRVRVFEKVTGGYSEIWSTGDEGEVSCDLVYENRAHYNVLHGV